MRADFAACVVGVFGKQDFVTPTATVESAALQASWEMDVFGAQRGASQAAQQRAEAAAASWHEARVSVAADVALAYVSLRACEARTSELRQDVASREETLRLTRASSRAGSQAPASEAQAEASAAQGRLQSAMQNVECEAGVKRLVAVTATDETQLRMMLAKSPARIPEPVGLVVPAVPGDLLHQRPDVYQAERELQAASAGADEAAARLLPRITLLGNIGPARFVSGPIAIDERWWSIGPLTVSLPILDGGVRRANLEAARAHHEEAAVAYEAKVWRAVSEVEEALVRSQGTQEQAGDALQASSDYDASLRSAEARFRGGLANLFELEDARRSAIQARLQLIEQRRSRVTVWVQLYRALGGGWAGESERSPAVGLGLRPQTEQSE